MDPTSGYRVKFREVVTTFKRTIVGTGTCQTIRIDRLPEERREVAVEEFDPEAPEALCKCVVFGVNEYGRQEHHDGMDEVNV